MFYTFGVHTAIFQPILTHKPIFDLQESHVSPMFFFTVSASRINSSPDNSSQEQFFPRSILPWSIFPEDNSLTMYINEIFSMKLPRKNCILG
jgi:hypothetical protein